MRYFFGKQYVNTNWLFRNITRVLLKQKSYTEDFGLEYYCVCTEQSILSAVHNNLLSQNNITNVDVAAAFSFQ